MWKLVCSFYQVDPWNRTQTLRRGASSFVYQAISMAPGMQASEFSSLIRLTSGSDDHQTSEPLVQAIKRRKRKFKMYEKELT